MRKPDKTPTPVELDEKSVKQEELRELSFSFLIPTVSGGGILLGNQIYIVRRLLRMVSK